MGLGRWTALVTIWTKTNHWLEHKYPLFFWLSTKMQIVGKVITPASRHLKIIWNSTWYFKGMWQYRDTLCQLRSSTPSRVLPSSLYQHLLSSFLDKKAMSGAAASAGASKFQAFLNHPAGRAHLFYSWLFRPVCIFFRTQDCILLGSIDEMVFGGSWT